jgi:hypothetical protein
VIDLHHECSVPPEYQQEYTNARVDDGGYVGRLSSYLSIVQWYRRTVVEGIRKKGRGLSYISIDTTGDSWVSACRK